MTVDARNLVTLSGGLTRDPEKVNDNIVKFGLAVDYASNDKDNPSGYFDVTMFLSDDSNRAVKFVKSQLTAGNFKKGSQISVVGRLSQDRWEKDNQKHSRVIIIAESLNYYGRKQTDGDSNGAAPRATASASSAPATEDEPAPIEF